MWTWRTTNKPPRGWLSYRQNLLVLYDEISASDDKIDALIDKTEYRGADARPSDAQQWSDLNEIELRLFRLLDDTRLVAETNRKFVQAEKSGLTRHLSALRTQFLAVQGGGSHAEAERRALAIAFLEEMFVKYSYEFAERQKRDEVSNRLTWFGLWIIGLPAILVFLWPIVESISQVFGSPVPSYPSIVPRVFDSLSLASSNFGAFFVVMYFGIVGAYFSRLFGYVDRLKELGWREMDLVYSPGALFVRLLVGAIGAVILFFLMTGKILSGPLFLEGTFRVFEGGDKPLVPLRPTEDFARLIVWCTLAGFSERFVPDRFGELEESARGSGKEGKEGNV